MQWARCIRMMMRRRRSHMARDRVPCSFPRVGKAQAPSVVPCAMPRLGDPYRFQLLIGTKQEHTPCLCFPPPPIPHRPFGPDPARGGLIRPASSRLPRNSSSRPPSGSAKSPSASGSATRRSGGGRGDSAGGGRGSARRRGGVLRDMRGMIRGPGRPLSSKRVARTAGRRVVPATARRNGRPRGC